eukprot:4366175-Prorocentrum_lima.AAC.1
MTSSLVGSEMCIRDRCSGALASLFDPLLLNMCIQSGLGMITRLLQAKAVSYTHLTLPTICSV